mmetsp:Transcript_11774/g.15996  ORF Transcript_11774/g.15996 Transcript_11774/m.15996 type:complete len:179 (+) Transcript_11774:110-646(+)
MVSMELLPNHQVASDELAHLYQTTGILSCLLVKSNRASSPSLGRSVGLATAALNSVTSACLLLDLRGHLQVAGGDQSLASAALNCDASAAGRAAHNTKGLVFLLVFLHSDKFVAQFNQDLLELLVLVPLLLILLFKELLALHALLQLALRHLQVHLQDRSLVHSVLVHRRNLLHASFE